MHIAYYVYLCILSKLTVYPKYILSYLILPLELGSSDLEGDGRGEERTEEQAGEVEMFINIFGGIKSYKGVTVYHLSFFF